MSTNPMIIRNFLASCLVLISPLLVSCRKQNQSGASFGPPAQTAAAPLALQALEKTRHAALWAEISAAFRQELTPDLGPIESGATIYPDKKIAGVWRCDNAFLVVIGQRTGNQDDDEGNRLFKIYNYARTTGEKSEVAARWPFWLWTYRQLARLDNTTVPDIVFESASCTECEPQMILSSQWKLRQCEAGNEGLELYGTAANVDGSAPEYPALSGIADFQRLGHDQIAIWMRYRPFEEKKPGEETSNRHRAEFIRISERLARQTSRHQQSGNEPQQNLAHRAGLGANLNRTDGPSSKVKGI